MAQSSDGKRWCPGGSGCFLTRCMGLLKQMSFRKIHLETCSRVYKQSLTFSRNKGMGSDFKNEWKIDFFFFETLVLCLLAFWSKLLFPVQKKWREDIPSLKSTHNITDFKHCEYRGYPHEEDELQWQTSIWDCHVPNSSWDIWLTFLSWWLGLRDVLLLRSRFHQDPIRQADGTAGPASASHGNLVSMLIQNTSSISLVVTCFDSGRCSRWLSGWGVHLERRRRHRFSPWVEKTPWRRAWQPTSVFLPGEFHGQRSLVSYSLWGRKRVEHKLDTT